MSLSHVKNKNTDKKMFLDFKPNHLISNVCAQVDQDDVTRKCERVYVRRMNILITAIEERERVTLCSCVDTWHRRGGVTLPPNGRAWQFHTRVSAIGNIFWANKSKDPASIDGEVWAGPTDALIDRTQKLKLTILLYIGDQYDSARLKVLWQVFAYLYIYV